MSILVLDPGMQSTIQANARLGQRHLGVPASGAADPLSLALANRLVGNDLLAPALEVTLVGPELRFLSDTQFALAGAPAAATVNGVEVRFHETIRVEAGDELVMRALESGARSYVAVAGGLRGDSILGSVSTYLPAALGGYEGRALRQGDVLQISAPVEETVFLKTPEEFRPPMTSARALRVCHAAEAGLLPDEELNALFDTNWSVGRRADRMGLALEGRALSIRSDGRLPSAAVFPGTIQCPEDGVPLLLSVDAQTTGGYPRVLQVTRADRHLMGQLRPGDHVRLLPRDPEGAIAELRAKLDFWREWLPGIESVLV